MRECVFVCVCWYVHNVVGVVLVVVVATALSCAPLLLCVCGGIM